MRSEFKLREKQEAKEIANVTDMCKSIRMYDPSMDIMFVDVEGGHRLLAIFNAPKNLYEEIGYFNRHIQEIGYEFVRENSGILLYKVI